MCSTAGGGCGHVRHPPPCAPCVGRSSFGSCGHLKSLLPLSGGGSSRKGGGSSGGGQAALSRIEIGWAGRGGGDMEHGVEAVPPKPGGGHRGGRGHGSSNVADDDNAQGCRRKGEGPPLLLRPLPGSGGVRLLREGRWVQDSQMGGSLSRAS